jgi:hypothetical protein
MPGDVRLIRSAVSISGMVLTTLSAMLFLAVLLGDLFGLHANPYLGAVFFLILPALFVIGLLLIPLGGWLERRRRARGQAPSAVDWPRIDLNDPIQRRTAIIVLVLTLANVVIVSLGAYRGVEYMDSVGFCGQVCHTPMMPEFVAHESGAHAGVPCVECHVGAGASSFAQAKMAGTRRLAAVLLGNYPRPIVAAAADLPPPGETCARCHRAQHFPDDRVRRVVEYADDEANTESVTTVRVHVGTIHARHSDTSCLECHNHPSHGIAPTPERAVSTAMANGAISRTLPFVHREAVKALAAAYPSREAGVAAIERDLRAFYGPKPGIDQAVGAVQNIYRLSVFPDMHVRFGTYASNIGHVDSPGCFRCHDDNHTSKTGKKIGQECDTCHIIE